VALDVTFDRANAERAALEIHMEHIAAVDAEV
jgi:hypothetical protein